MKDIFGKDDTGDSSSTTSNDENVCQSSFQAVVAVPNVRRLSAESREPENHSKATCLPSELLLEIFKFLPSTNDLYATLLTCQSWCECSVETLWYKPLIYRKSALDKLLATVAQEEMTFDYPLFIRRLNLSYLVDDVDDSTLLKLYRCKKLERLTLVNCSKVTDRGLCDVLSRNQGLIALDITNLEFVTDLSILVAASRNRMLQGINLAGCSKITDDAITTVALNCQHLRRIKLNSCFEVKDRSIYELARNSRHLLEIDLDHCHQVTSTSVNELIRRCSELRELRLNLCSQIDDECFSSLRRESYMSLRSLDLTGCSRITDESVHNIVLAAPKIRTLVFAKCPNITDRGAVEIARLGKHIHFLHLGHCSQLTDRCIGFLAKYCIRLRYIDLACCVQLTDHAVAELAGLQRLKRIGLVKCSEITPAAISALVEKNTVQHTLERIHLSYCNNLQLDCIRDLLNSCRRLTHISLTGVPAFLRHDLTEFCRLPPKEFNAAQASVFCVFSASGVINLRNRLNKLFASQIQGDLGRMQIMSIDDEPESMVMEYEQLIDSEDAQATVH